MAINPMPSPIDYVGMQPQINPGRALLEGLQVGSAIRGMRQQRQQEEEAARMKEQFSIDMQSYLANPTAAGSRELILKYPQMREVVAENWSSLSKEMQDEEFKFATNVSMALKSNNPEVAARLIEQRRDAFANAGKDTTSLDTMLETANTNPTALPVMANLYGASLDPEKWGDYVKAIGGEEAEEYRILTPEEVAQNPGLDPTKTYQQNTVTKKISQVGSGGTTVSVDLGQERASAALEKLDIPRAQEFSAAAASARSFARDARVINELLKGKGGGESVKLTAEFAKRLGIKTELVTVSDLANSLSIRGATQLRAPGSGSQSDLEFKSFASAFPSLSNSESGRDLLATYSESFAKRAAKLADHARKLIREDKYSEEEMARFDESLGPILGEDFYSLIGGQMPQSGATAAPAAGQPVTVNTPQGPIKFPNQAAADAYKKAAGLQ